MNRSRPSDLPGSHHLPDLRFVPTDSILPHERRPAAAGAARAQIREESALKNRPS
jgi:hypothetical protein